MVKITEILENKKLTKKESDELKSGIDQFFKLIGNLPADLLIFKQTLLPYRYSFNYFLRDPDKLSLYGKGNLTLEFKNFNKDVKIQAPSDFIYLKDLFKNYFTDFEFSTNTPASSF